MADRNRRFTVAAIALPFLFLVMSGLARANIIIVNSLGGNTDAVLCTLPDAIASANNGFGVAGCANSFTTTSGADIIGFNLTGTIFVDVARLPLNISDEVLEIQGPFVGGITVDAGLNPETAGGIINVNSLNHFFKVSNLTFAHGNAQQGGAIFLNSGHNMDVKTCLFVDNVAQNLGGTGNGGQGGAIYAGTGSFEVTNSTFFENDALKFNNTFGGAIYINTGVTGKVTNDTFEHNYAKTGSAIYNLGTADVKGTIFADQLDKAGTGVTSPKGNCAGSGTPPVTDENYNISVDSSCGFTAGSSLNNVTAADLDLDPAGLANNGGPSFTVALLAGSDAIDRIPVANCTEQDSHSDPLGTDQRLFGRPDPGNVNTCDSGAFEFGALGPYTLNNERVQIATATPGEDQVNMGLTFTSNGDPDCDLGFLGDEDALFDGVGIGLVQGTCSAIPANSGLFLSLFNFSTHTVGLTSYGTLLQTFGSETVSARIVALTPPEGLCGRWTLNIEVDDTDAGLLNLTGGNPYALLISDFQDGESCFDIHNAIVGTQLTPPKRSTRRGVRR